MEGPTSPVCKIGVPCERPVAGLVLEFKRGGSVIARVKTSAKGTYRVRLRAASYSVTTVPPRRVGTGLTPKSVRVRKALITRRDFHLDTGLR
jgi:hypothetical protein